MNEMEELLRRDRAAGAPEAPDMRYTVAAVRRRLEETPGAVPQASVKRLLTEWPRSGDWPMLLIAVGTLAVGAGAALIHGLDPRWLLVVPMAAIPLCPILLRKGV